MPIDAAACLGTHDILFITLDSLRYDVARDAMAAGHTPHLQALAPGGAWEHRHSPSSFTYGAHTSFFAGFLPSPAQPGRAANPRLFATRFPGSRSVDARTMVFDEADIVTGLRGAGYHTICIGGVGFFNKRSPLGSVLPDLFDESWWSPALGVTERHSTRYQVSLACERLAEQPQGRRTFLFLNVSACHAPNRAYVQGATRDSRETQAAALAYVDLELPPLIAALQARAPTLCVICADHGEAYGEDGYSGHRLGHPSVWDVPYLETILPQSGDA